MDNVMVHFLCLYLELQKVLMEKFLLFMSFNVSLDSMAAASGEKNCKPRQQL